MILAAVWTGGMIGAWCRYRFSSWIYGRTGTGFPWGTLSVNLSGSLLLGLLLPWLAGAEPLTPLRAFVTVGVLSSFTTFSTFALEVVLLIEDGHRRRAAVYVAASLLLGLAAIAVGLAAGYRLVPGVA